MEEELAYDALPTPPDMTGQSIGGYQLKALLGAGGMGEVYRSRDAKLGRDVAIKILPRAFTSHPDRLARFEREARMLAALNHPNICAIYGFEEAALRQAQAGGHPVPDSRARRGRDACARASRRRELRQRGGLPLARGAGDRAADRRGARGRARQRDRPPRPEAREHQDHAGRGRQGAGLRPRQGRRWRWRVAGSDAASPTDEGGTREGAILGTAAYMSPEQARGLPVDKRTDIWAFGCVLYEMLTGRVAFAGDTVSDSIAKILEREPDWSALPAATPVAIRRVLLRCLDEGSKETPERHR